MQRGSDVGPNRARTGLVPPPGAVDLVFEVDPDPVDQAKVVLSHWLTGRAPTAVAATSLRARRDLEAEVDRVIAEPEAEPGITQPPRV
ncbi:hypothetical protein [Saccharothrix luteola]|uniref:hypothetical protein n=1 Tax=Saccharothrix luteola TaxID=2893018 RepID=UPI001E56CD76|nr:hypothetical protein [Saccharothrix luteola]MCC8246741.1 hypothetical protein [Saccharothrix luteola]